MALPPHLDRLPPGCLLDRRVRTDFEDEYEFDFIADQQPFRILRCVDRKASGFSPVMQPYAEEVVQSLHIGVHLAKDEDDSSTNLSCLVLKGGSPLTTIEAVDEGVIVLTTTFLHDFSRIIYVVYDAVRGSLHMAPAPEDPSWIFTRLTVRLLIARPSCGDDYALVLLGKLDQQGDALLVWRPGSSAVPWSEVKVASFPSGISGKSSSYYQADVTFSANGMGCWADLLRGGMYCHWDTLFNNNGGDNEPLLKFHLFPLPKELANAKSLDHRRSNSRVAQPKAYRTVGVVNHAVLFVSVDGFLEPVKNKDRTVSVWSLRKEDMDWELLYKVHVKDLARLGGFGNLPTNLTPMYPLLSPTDDGVVYLALGKLRENRTNWTCIPRGARHLLALNIRMNTIQSTISLEECSDEPFIPNFLTSNFCKYARVVDLDSHILMMEMRRQQSSTEQDGRADLPAHYYFHSRLAQSGIIDTVLEHHSEVIME